LDVDRNDEAALWRVEWPEVCAEDHNAEAHIHVIVVLFHAHFESVRHILAKTYVYNIGEQLLRV
jgi:hypothetical protein